MSYDIPSLIVYTVMALVLGFLMQIIMDYVRYLKHPEGKKSGKAYIGAVGKDWQSYAIKTRAQRKLWRGVRRYEREQYTKKFSGTDHSMG